MATDSEIIETLGGAAKVAELLGYEKHGGTQRVHNWITRGIPPKVKLERPDLFIVTNLARETPDAASQESDPAHLQQAA